LESVCAGDRTEGSNPSLSATTGNSTGISLFDRCIGAGLSSAHLMESCVLAVLGGELAVPCNLQSAPAGLNSPSERSTLRLRQHRRFPLFQPCAMSRRQPRQTRKGAAVPGLAHVPQVYWGSDGGALQDLGLTPRKECTAILHDSEFVGDLTW
jgi:hypothetical protein